MAIITQCDDVNITITQKLSDFAYQLVAILIYFKPNSRVIISCSTKNYTIRITSHYIYIYDNSDSSYYLSLRRQMIDPSQSEIRIYCSKECKLLSPCAVQYLVVSSDGNPEFVGMIYYVHVYVCGLYIEQHKVKGINNSLITMINNILPEIVEHMHEFTIVSFG